MRISSAIFFELKGLIALNLMSTELSDEGIKSLEELKNLTTLNLAWCDKLTGAGIQSLKESNLFLIIR